MKRILFFTLVLFNLFSRGVGGEDVDDKEIRFHYLYDAFTRNENGTSSSILLSTVFEIEYMNYLTDYFNKEYSEHLWSFRLKVDDYLIDTSMLSQYVFNDFSKNFDFYVGPKNSLHMDTLHGVNTISKTLLFTHGATSEIYDSTARHLNIVRSLPSDRFRVDVLVKLIDHFNFNYLAIVQSENMRLEVIRFANILRQSEKHCIGQSYVITHRTDAKDTPLCNTIEYLNRNEHHRIVLLFTTFEDSARVLRCMREQKIYGRFQLIFFHNYNDHVDLLPNNGRLLDGAIGIRARSTPDQDFIGNFFDRFKSLTPANGTQILRHYWQQRHLCNAFFDIGLNPDRYPRNCTFKEHLQPAGGWEPSSFLTEKTAFLPETLGCIIQLLDMHFGKVCGELADSDWWRACNRSYIATSIEQFKQKLLASARSHFSADNYCKHNENLRYDVTNNKFDPDYLSTSTKRVFQWGLNVKKSQNAGVFLKTAMPSFLQLGNVWWGEQLQYSEPFGNCSRACKPGQTKYRNYKARDSSCCWECHNCKKNQIVTANETTCKTCGKFQQPDAKRRKCLTLEKRSFEQLHKNTSYVHLGLVLLCVCAVVILLTSVIRRRDAKLFTASGIYQWIGILVGLFFTLVGAGSFSFEPTFYVCWIRAYVAPVAFCFFHCLMVVKGIRILIVFKGTSKFSSFYHLIGGKKYMYMNLVLGGVVFEGVLLFALSTNGISKVKDTVNPEGAFISTHCSLTPHWMAYVLNIVLFFWPCIQLRNMYSLPHNHNETRDLFVASIISLFEIFFVITAFALPIPVAYKNELLFGWFLLVDCAVSITALFGKKFYLLVTGRASASKHDDDSPRFRSFSANVNSNNSNDITQVRVPLQMTVTSVNFPARTCKCPIALHTLPEDSLYLNDLFDGSPQRKSYLTDRQESVAV